MKFFYLPRKTFYNLVEPQHKMYWNGIPLPDPDVSIDVEPQHKMYWNSDNLVPTLTTKKVEPQHKMYWNFVHKHKFKFFVSVEPQHKMYWNPELSGKHLQAFLLNHNIRCIEMALRLLHMLQSLVVEPQHKMYWNLNYLIYYL